MSKLNELIKKYCPAGISYKAFGELATIARGASPRPIKKFITTDSNGINWIKIGDVKPGAKYITECAEKITIEGSNKSRFVKKGDFILSNSMSFGRPYILSIDGCIHDGWLAISNFDKSYITDFLYHLLNSNNCQNELKKRASFGGAVQNLNADIVRSLVLPVPPLPVQEEIVRILDSFTSLTAELQAELKARKKQYEYYRNILYTKHDYCPKKKLIDISDISRGIRVVKKNLIDDGKFPVYQNSLTPMGYYNKSNVTENTTYVISAGAAGEIGFCNTNFWAADDCLVFSNLKEIRNKYIYYFLLTKQDFIRSNVRKASVPRLSRTVIENLQIPIISLEEQDKILSLLDRFDTICNDITTGLPAEIAARQKQYEYYRDKLLTFKELS